MEIAPYTIAAPASTSASARMKERRSRAIEFYRKESEPNCISERHSSSIEKPHRLDGEYRGQYSRRGDATPQLPEAIAFLTNSKYPHRNVARPCQSEGASWSRRDKPDRSRRPRLIIKVLPLTIVNGDGLPRPSPVPPWNRRSPVLRGRGFSMRATASLPSHFG